MRDYDLSLLLLRQWIGFDKLANALKSAAGNPSFPPYNIEKIDNARYRITLSIPGFCRENLDIQLEDTHLFVKGTPKKPEIEQKWLHHGLVIQPFSLSFTLAEYMEVIGAAFSNGLLHIDIIRNTQETISPQRIIINKNSVYN